MENSRAPKKSANKGVIALFILAAALFAALGFVRLWVIGGYECADITVESVFVSENIITLKGRSNSSFAAFKDYRCEVGEDTVTVYLTYVLPGVYRGGDFDLTIEGDFSNVYEVDISDENNALVVWIDE